MALLYIRQVIGFWEVAFLIILIVLILVIPSKLPQILKDLGRAIREFRKALQETEEAASEVKKSLSPEESKEEEGKGSKEE
jgi:Sec-independent protein secretion pathway components|uniref:Twin-arginine translocase TatA/TatE family subunit n=1 Tax=Ignisphaera aggregans TaxID=334771 RepID=A0A7J3Z5B6_9CREN